MAAFFFIPIINLPLPQGPCIVFTWMLVTHISVASAVACRQAAEQRAQLTATLRYSADLLKLLGWGSSTDALT